MYRDRDGPGYDYPGSQHPPDGLLLSFDGPIESTSVDQTHSNSSGFQSSHPPFQQYNSSHRSGPAFSQLPPIDTDVRPRAWSASSSYSWDNSGHNSPSLTPYSPDFSPPNLPSTSSESLPTSPITDANLLEMFLAGKLASRESSLKCWEFQCCSCRQWISSSIPTTRRLTTPGHFKVLEQHMHGRRCKPPSEPRSAASFSVPREHFQIPSDLSPVSPSTSHIPWSPNSAATSPPMSPPELGSPSLPGSVDGSQLFDTNMGDDYDLHHQRFSSAPPELQPGFVPRDEPVVNRPGFGGECSGLNVEWPSDLSFRLTFPFHRLTLRGEDGDLPFEIEIHDHGRTVTVWSKACLRSTTPHSAHCQNCDAIHGRLEDIAAIARNAKKGTNYKFLSHDQLRNLLVERNEELNKLKLESLNLGRRLATFARKMDDFERLLVAIAENDVPRIHTIIETALRNGASIRTITNKIYDAFEGLLSTKGFTDFEKDLGILIYRLGGRSLLYAMNKALNLPSLRTICNSARFIKITPTIGPIREEEIRDNIDNVLLRAREDADAARSPPTPSPRKGVSIMMDEVALEEQACYFSHANQVGGLCSKHCTAHTPLTLTTHESALGIVEALADEKIHFGTEMAVVAAKCKNEKVIYPILCAPSCKKETAEDMKDLFEMIIKVWKERAEGSVGNIWDFATDGDKLRRKAGYALFVQFELGPHDTLYIHVGNLPGLNLFMSPDRILLTFDWRHILKRLCTLLRHLLGITMDNGRIINPNCLRRCLLLLPGQDEASVERLIDPDDPQDVPRAIMLLEAIVALRVRRPELDVPPSNIELNCDLDSISLFSHMVGALLCAFTDPTASLSMQIQSLSLYAHLAFVFFRQYRLAFMSNQLYGDSQTMVKNIVFTVAKQKELDPAGEINAYHDGTDPVEEHFGFLRETGGHNSAMNFKQAIERSGWACDIAGVHARNPGLHAGHRRRNVTRAEVKDHLNEYNFTGDMVSGHCDLGASWRSGRLEAVEILDKSSRLHPSTYDFQRILSTPNLDFLRPLGDGIYMGVLDDLDRSVPLESDSSSAAEQNSVPQESVPPVSGPSFPPYASDSMALPIPSLRMDTPLSPPETAPPLSSAPLQSSCSTEPSIDDMLPASHVPIISFEEVLESEPSEPEGLKLQPRKGVNPNDYLRDGSGKYVHKASVCRLLLNKEFIAKSKNRGERAAGLALKRVRCYTKPNGTQRLNADASITGASFITGDLFLTLVRTSASVALAVVRSTEIWIDSKRAPSVNINSIKNPKANVKLAGQIYKLTAVAACADDMSESDVRLEDDGSASLTDTWTWLWTGSSLMTKSTMKGTNISTDKPHLITVLGHLTEPVSPKAVEARDRLAGESLSQLNSTGVTWAFAHDLLNTLIVQLWQHVDIGKTGLKEVPTLKDPLPGFPYAWSDGVPALLSDAGTAYIVEKSSPDSCLYCPEVPANWRGHMGGHIIRRLRNAGETERDRKEKKAKSTRVWPQVSDSYPCGFCGRSGNPECAVTMRPKGESFEITKCDCSYRHNFNYNPANTGSSKTPSRNVPVICALCPRPEGRYPLFPGIWRYNMEQHLRDRHPEYASPLQPEGDILPFELWLSARVEYNEQLLLGVPENLIPVPFTKFIHEAEGTSDRREESDEQRASKRGRSTGKATGRGSGRGSGRGLGRGASRGRG
ncbi:hypothetical protein R3P38DRAFT_3019043 [Favolaschia claudopus]|uniref:Uncharacterized protein n=1 Tax=Favolaschia claudopus TaxID=2862362 RepID=A0AAW0AH72_9AGAR